MSKKRLHSRIKHFFTDLAQEGISATLPLDSGNPYQPSELGQSGQVFAPQPDIKVEQKNQPMIWFWETDASLNYTACSPEVIEALHIPAQELLGESILTCAVHSATKEKLASAFKENNHPCEVNVLFTGPGDRLIPGRMHILPPVKSGKSITGWKGYSVRLPDTAGLSNLSDFEVKASANRLRVITSQLGGNNKPKETKPSLVKPMPSPSGYAIENGAVHSSIRVWTKAGESSLADNETTVTNASREEPAAIAVPMQTQEIGKLLLEIVDDDSQRAWSEDDRFLVMEVAAQLALALDNAQLYNSVQQELSERVRAEQVILRRNKDLAALNQIGQQLSRLATRGEIYELLSTMIGEVLDNRDLYICAYTRDPNMVEFPVYRQNGLPVEMPARPFGNDVPEYIFRTQNPLLVTSQAEWLLETLGISLSGPCPASLMAIPMITGDRLAGAIVIQDFQKEHAYDTLHVELLSTAAAQATTALENAQAYELSQQAIDEMKELDRVKSQFLANMSHELRTPLNSIIGFSRVIIKGIDGPVSDLQKQDLSAIYNSGQHLLRLINDILDLSKIEAGKMEVNLAEISLVDMINSTMSTAAGLVKDKPIQLRTIIPESLPLVRADNTRIRQVLINFLSNAAKFTEEGTITVEAMQSLDPEGKPEVMVTVTDSGSGIAPADQAKLFLPFSQVDDSPTRKTGGTGLGLSICRSLIDMHGGRIGLLRSVVGQGSTFFFSLPLEIKDSELSFNAIASGSNLILAIDDDPRVINLYQRYLEPHGYTIYPLTDPSQAVKKASEINPTAITLDIMMPQKDGWHVLQDLKNDPTTRNIPIIICSILENQEKGFSMGAADYLVKPFLEEDILNVLGRLNHDGKIRDVLIIDDDPDDLRLVQKIFEKDQRYRVTAAQGGVIGWEAIQSSRPDAVLLDLFMPDMNGFMILEHLRTDPSLRNTPVIILTGADLTPEQHRQITDFSQGILAKGYMREKELLVLVEDALRKIRPNQNVEK